MLARDQSMMRIRALRDDRSTFTKNWSTWKKLFCFWILVSIMIKRYTQRTTIEIVEIEDTISIIHFWLLNRILIFYNHDKHRRFTSYQLATYFAINRRTSECCRWWCPGSIAVYSGRVSEWNRRFYLLSFSFCSIVQKFEYWIAFILTKNIILSHFAIVRPLKAFLWVECILLQTKRLL